MIEIPDKTSIIQLSRSEAWLDEEGILYSVPRPDAESGTISEEDIHGDVTKIKEMIGEKKVGIILEINPVTPIPSKVQRDLIAKQLDALTIALGIITGSPLTKMVANLYFGFKPPEYPVKMFTEVEEAKNWIRQYL
jgi:hypothetical protein